MDPLMMLVVGWTLVGGFVFTMIVTCLSMVGWIRFADRTQQKKLFTLLIVELVVGVGAKALGGVTLDASGVKQEIAAEGEHVGRTRGTLEATHALLAPGAPPVAREQLETVVDLLVPAPGVVTSVEIEALRKQVDALPTGAVKATDAAALERSDVLRRGRIDRRDVRVLPR